MTFTASQPRAPWIAGLALGLYAAAIALTPGVTGKALLCAPMLALPIAWWALGGASRWLALFFLSAWLLPPLPIAIGNSGPHAALIFAAAGLWIGLIRLPEWRFQSDGVSLAMLALLACLCLSLPMALLFSGPPIAAASAARVVLFAISIYVYWFVRHGPGVNSLRLVRLMFWTAVVAALFACVDFYFQFPAPAGYGPQFVWLDTGVFRRAQGLFYEASTLGNFCAFFLAMIGVALFAGRETRILPVWALLGGGTIFAAALVLSYSRGSLINVMAAFGALAWLRRKRIPWMRIPPLACILAGAAAALLFAVFPQFAWAYWTRAAASAQYFFESPNAVLSGRLRSWTILIDFIRLHPWYAALGVGYKTLPYSGFIGAAAVADNAYLSALLETGLGGLLAVLALNAAILRASYRASQSEPRRSFLGAWMFCFWIGQTIQMLSGDLLTYWRVLPAYFCVLALAARE